jgi:hypothetical protein
MNSTTHALSCALVIAGLCGSAHAASFEHIDHVISGGYSATSNNTLEVSDSALAAVFPAAFTLAGAADFHATLDGGTIDHGYTTQASLGFQATHTAVHLALTHGLTVTAASALSAISHQQDAFADLSAVTLRIAGAPGEAAGTAVQVSFAGSASALFDIGAPGAGYLGLGLSVARGDTVLGDYLWDVTATGQQQVNFSFSGIVGEALTFSGYMVSGAALEAADFGTALSPYRLVDVAAQLDGNFTITPVPEPETWLLLLAGLGMVGTWARRRNAC